jgi:hypothetical protein
VQRRCTDRAVIGGHASSCAGDLGIRIIEIRVDVDLFAVLGSTEFAHVRIRRAAAKTLKGFCLTYLPHHFPLDPSDFFDEMLDALGDYDIKRLEEIGFRGCAKSTAASLGLVLWAARPLGLGLSTGVC